MSAPSPSAWVVTGEAQVPSTATTAPAAWPISAAAAISITSQFGLTGVSSQTSAVSPGRTAASRLAGSAASNQSTPMPRLSREPHQPVLGAVIHDPRCDDALAHRHRLEQRRTGRETRAEQQRRSPVLEARDDPLGVLDGGAGVAAVDEPVPRAHSPHRAQRSTPAGFPARRPPSPGRSRATPGRRGSRPWRGWAGSWRGRQKRSA